MLRRELLIGYVVAGFLAVLVPDSAWNAVFMHGHGIWTTIENAIVGPVIAFLSFVCSIGNVPLAAALWKGGISFGGVISFIFADLLAAPLVLIYRRYYGGALTLRLVGIFWVVMAAAGLAVEGIFAAAGIIPTHRPTHIVDTGFQWNYTTVLNLVFLAVFAYLYWLYRHRERFGSGAGYATDPARHANTHTRRARLCPPSRAGGPLLLRPMRRPFSSRSRPLLATATTCAARRSVRYRGGTHHGHGSRLRDDRRPRDHGRHP